MKPNFRIEVGPLEGTYPVPASEVGPAEQGTLGADEDELALRCRRQMGGKDLCQKRRHGQHPPAGPALGFLDVDRGLAVNLLQSPNDPHPAAEQIEVLPLEP